MTKPKGNYTDRTGETIDIDGRPFQVTVHWGMVNGQARCVGVDLRSFTSKNSAKVDLSDAQSRNGWAEITSPVLRGLRIAEVIETSRRDVRLMREMVAALPEPDRKSLARKARAGTSKPGPASRWTFEVLRDVVAPAYRTGGRKPALAVQERLTDHFGEPVTRDMARKALGRARRVGLLPKYERGA